MLQVRRQVEAEHASDACRAQTRESSKAGVCVCVRGREGGHNSAVGAPTEQRSAAEARFVASPEAEQVACRASGRRAPPRR